MLREILELGGDLDQEGEAPDDEELDAEQGIEAPRDRPSASLLACLSPLLDCYYVD